MASKNLKEVIKAESERLGFCLFGISTAKSLQGFQRYSDWIKHDYHANMAYLGTDRALQLRANPDMVLSGARSIISLGVKYPAPGKFVSNNGYGKIAAYASGEDYHITLINKLNELITSSLSVTGRDLSTRIYTDTGPLLEREMAQQAGLGWFGKNSCLISPKYGSFVLICEILTDLELEPDAPFISNYCGTCTRCIDACPTGCILPDRTVDASRCISYHTIENKVIIPVEMREKMGNMVFGCDICQDVCPWNSGARLTAGLEASAFKFRPEIHQIDLREELLITHTEFAIKYRNTPVKRSKYAGFTRNLIIAAGNSRDPVHVSRLAEFLADSENLLLQYHAAWALGKIEDKKASYHLNRMLKQTSDPQLKLEIINALKK